jgi:hypothetical protein
LTSVTTGDASGPNKGIALDGLERHEDALTAYAQTLALTPELAAA